MKPEDRIATIAAVYIVAILAMMIFNDYGYIKAAIP